MGTVDLLPYPIVVADGELSRIAAHVQRHAPGHRYAIVTDAHVAPHYLAPVRETLVAAAAAERVHTVVVPAGEAHKTREQWAAITDTLLAAGCGRDTTVIALGGGVVGDLAGFVAATFMRGIPVVQVPTTMLAMVDASVGGKTAVDTPAGKNTVGAFHAPAVVIIDPSTLRTLPWRELRSGLAEVLKHAIIAAPRELDAIGTLAPAMCTGTGDRGSVADLIERSVAIKARVVAEDERELGLRKVLNFGHTIGHGIEAASSYALLHGEAIAIGMVAESRMAERAGIAEPGTASLIETAVEDTGLPVRVPADLDPVRILALMQSDKKRRRDSLEYAVPTSPGRMAGADNGYTVTLPDTLALEVLSAMRAP